MADLDQLRYRLGPDPLGGRVGADQLRMVPLDSPQLVEQRVVLIVSDLGVVEHVVAVVVVLQCPAELPDPLVGTVATVPVGRRAHDCTSLAAGATSRSRS